MYEGQFKFILLVTFSLKGTCKVFKEEEFTGDGRNVCRGNPRSLFMTESHP
jgi:hypothetical protein